MKIIKNFFKRSWIPAAATLIAIPTFAAIPTTPELDTLQVAKLLRPIPDDEWKEIAGDRVSETYEIERGDTLYDISKRLFGDAKYWPKIWALNNGNITNPHFILPGHEVAFLPGTGTSLPSLKVTDTLAENDTTPDEQFEDEDTATDAESRAKSLHSHRRSTEWKRLPKQPWESVSITMPPEVDALGFDRRSRVTKGGASSFTLPETVRSDKVAPLGLVFGGEKEANFITLQDLVFIHKEQDLQVGQSYSLSTIPVKLESRYTERTGFIYPMIGKVKILQERDGAYIGLITSAANVIERGSILLPLEPKIPLLTPIPGPSPLEASVMLNRSEGTFSSAQHKFVFVDRGTEDGVNPGMIFRIYQHRDQSNGKRMVGDHSLIAADIMVVQTSPHISTGLIVSSYTYVTEGSTAVLLTDVSQLLKKHGPDWLRIEMQGALPTPAEAPDELDQLDNGMGLNDREKQELKQLERWKENPPPAPSPVPSPVPSPAESLPAPAPSEELPPPTAPMGNEELPPPAPETAPPATPSAPEAVPAPAPETPPPPPATDSLPPPPPGDEEIPAPPS